MKTIEELMKLSKNEVKKYVNENGIFEQSDILKNVSLNWYDHNALSDSAKVFFKSWKWVKNFTKKDQIPKGANIILMEVVASQNFKPWTVSRNNYAINQEWRVFNQAPYITLDHDASKRGIIGQPISKYHNANWDTMMTFYINLKYIENKDKDRANQIADWMYKYVSTAHYTLEDAYRNKKWEVKNIAELVEEKGQQATLDIVLWYDPEWSYYVVKADMLHLSLVDIPSNPWAKATQKTTNNSFKEWGRVSLSSAYKAYSHFDKDIILNRLESNTLTSESLWVLSKIVDDEELLNKIKENKGTATKASDNNIIWEESLWEQLRDLVKDEAWENYSAYICDIYKNEFVYNLRWRATWNDAYTDAYYRRDYTQGTDEITIWDDAVEVEPKRSRIDVTNAIKKLPSTNDSNIDAILDTKIEEMQDSLKSTVWDELTQMMKNSFEKMKSWYVKEMQDSLEEVRETKEEIKTILNTFSSIEEKCEEMLTDYQSSIDSINKLSSLVETAEKNSKEYNEIKPSIDWLSKLALNASKVVMWYQKDMLMIKEKVNTLSQKKWESYVNMEIQKNEFEELVEWLFDESVNRFLSVE